jgi:pilus assembly protein CpaB
MNRRRGWVPLAIGLVLALGTGVATFFLLQQQRQAAAAEAVAVAAQEVAPVVTMKLPVAARPLTAGTTLTAEDMLLKDFPLDLVPMTAITETATLESQILAESVGQGETFNLGQLVGEAADRASYQLAAGHVLFAYPINDLLSRSNVIEDGDRIDLLITLPVASADGTINGPVTAFTLQNISVFKVLRGPSEDEADNGSAVALLLSVEPQDAVMLKHVKDSEGVMDFVLRSVLDTESVDVPPVDRIDLLDRYDMR